MANELEDLAKKIEAIDVQLKRIETIHKNIENPPKRDQKLYRSLRIKPAHMQEMGALAAESTKLEKSIPQKLVSKKQQEIQKKIDEAQRKVNAMQVRIDDEKKKKEIYDKRAKTYLNTIENFNVPLLQFGLAYVLTDKDGKKKCLSWSEKKIRSKLAEKPKRNILKGNPKNPAKPILDELLEFRINTDQSIYCSTVITGLENYKKTYEDEVVKLREKYEKITPESIEKEEIAKDPNLQASDKLAEYGKAQADLKEIYDFAKTMPSFEKFNFPEDAFKPLINIKNPQTANPGAGTSNILLALHQADNSMQNKSNQILGHVKYLESCLKEQRKELVNQRIALLAPKATTTTLEPSLANPMNRARR